MTKKKKEDMTPEERAKSENRSQGQKNRHAKAKTGNVEAVLVVPTREAPKFEVPKHHSVIPKVSVAVQRELYSQLIIDVNIQTTLKGEYNVTSDRLIDDLTAVLSAAAEDYLTKHIEEYRIF